jgi:hypothetical protein
MGWFSKKDEGMKKSEVPLLPELPKLPELPELPKLKDTKVPRAPIPQLPSFPTNSIGERFSQNNIKEAVTGRKEHEEDFSDEDEEDNFAVEGDSMQNAEHKSLRKPMAIEMSSEYEKKSNTHHHVPDEFREAAKKVKSAEPVFIRIDKFEESLKTFNETKEKITDMEKMLRDIKKIKEEEESELEAWESEIKTMKNQIERVDRDIFSKVE